MTSESHDMYYPGQYTLAGATFNGLVTEIERLRAENAKLESLLTKICRHAYKSQYYFPRDITEEVNPYLYEPKQ
jgi:hypothetical protein